MSGRLRERHSPATPSTVGQSFPATISSLRRYPIAFTARAAMMATLAQENATTAEDLRRCGPVKMRRLAVLASWAKLAPLWPLCPRLGTESPDLPFVDGRRRGEKRSSPGLWHTQGHQWPETHGSLVRFRRCCRLAALGRDRHRPLEPAPA